MNRRILGLVLPLLLACTKTSDPSPGSQTHFLDTCDGNCPSGLVCLCGVCTLECDDGDDAMCAERAESATCSAASGSEQACAGAERVCDVECASDRECGALGAGFVCEDGRCREQPSAGAGAGAGGRAGASAGAGGRAGAGGQPLPGPDGGAIDAGPAPDAGFGPDAGPICSLPPLVGPCEALIPRWYHDPSAGQCRMFNYGGCQGNANNFETQAECETACDVTPLPVGGASCEVGGTVYPSGTDGIDDPQSCNTCSCDEGQLICTDIACPEPCPAGTVYATSCSACGPVDNCERVRHDCLPTCETSADCTGDAPPFCFDGICRVLCG
jgi:hypothetical protein